MKGEGYQEMEEAKKNLLEDHKQCDINDQHEEDTSWDKRTFASTFEAFWNTCNTIQGLPILVIPYAVRNGGYLAIFTLLLVAAASNYTGKTIVRCLYETDPKSGKRKRVRDSYVDIGDAFLPNLGGNLVLVTQFVELLFVAGVYPLLVGRILAKSFPHVTVPCWLWTLFGGILFFPNIFLKNLSQVAWTSILTVLSAKVIFFTVVTYSVLHVQKWEISHLENFDASTYPSALGVLVASYLSQPFVSLIEGSMRYKEKFDSVMNLSYLAMTLLNVTIGVVAYNLFEGETAEVITNNLPEGSFRVAVNVMAAVLSITSYTLPMFTIFEIIENSSLFLLPGSFGKSIFTPSVIVFRMSMDMTWCNIVADGVVVVVGVIVMVTGTISSVFSLIKVYSQPGNDECA
ncbi:Vesicular inhibitory amino acid transporter [Stylophora pistillata]|uniref:Vesicular inhibitory amino acid transporter n=1 Tax=Stylophora pistillata TaxID=50429 RepID=A0A2B4SJA5_STYPI|nr:Vesicular inhibitory amino acid transporter [Stylophora pistillata]